MRVITFLIILFVSQQLPAPPIHLPDNYEAITEMIVQVQKKQELNKFLDAIGISESAGKYTIWNKYGYIGKYQFGASARKSTGFKHIKFRNFIKNPAIWTPEQQEEAMIKLMEKNEAHLQSIINDVESGKLVILAKGKVVTKSGLLGGAHLAGFAGVMRYVKTGRNPKDAYGTSLEDYLIKFSGYKI